MRPVRILVFVQTALTLVFTYSDSLRVKRSNPVNNNAVANATQIPAGQWIPACAGMTTDGARGDKIKTLGPRGDTGESDMGMYRVMTRKNGANAPSFISRTNNPFPDDLDYMFRS